MGSKQNKNCVHILWDILCLAVLVVNYVISNTIVFTTKPLICECSSDEMIGPRIPAADD